MVCVVVVIVVDVIIVASIVIAAAVAPSQFLQFLICKNICRKFVCTIITTFMQR